MSHKFKIKIMKNLAITLTKGLLIIVLFACTSVVLSTTGMKTGNEAKADAIKEANVIGEQEIVEYLEEYGYQVVACAPKPNSLGDWHAIAILDGKYTFVVIYVVDNNIVGHADHL